MNTQVKWQKLKKKLIALKPKQWFWIWISIIAGTGLIVTATFIVRSAATMSWPDTPGIIISSDMRSRVTRSYTRDRDSGLTDFEESTSYWAEIVYTYSVMGTSYKSSNISNTLIPLTSESTETEKVGRYPPGKNVTVYYNPANPGQAVLENGFSFITIIQIVVIIIAALVIFYFCFLELRSRVSTTV